MQKLFLVLVAVAGCLVVVSCVEQEDRAQKLNATAAALPDVCKNKNASVDDMKLALSTQGADVNARDSDGTTPLMLAAEYNPNPEVITLLINAGADVNARNEDGDTPLIRASLANPNPDVITALINAGADINARDKGGRTPLILAAKENKNSEIISVLLEAGADAKHKDKDGKTALDYVKLNEALKDTNAYWDLNDASFE